MSMSREEALLVREFDFDTAQAFSEWSKGKGLFVSSGDVDIPRIILQYQGEPLKAPPETLEKGTFLEVFKQQNPEFSELLETLPQFINFFSQSSGIGLQPGKSGMKDLISGPNLQRVSVGHSKLPLMRINENERGGQHWLEIHICSQDAGDQYGVLDRQEELVPQCSLAGDESVLILPFDPKTKKFTGEGRLKMAVLLRKLKNSDEDEFEQFIDHIQKAKCRLVERVIFQGQGTRIQQTNSTSQFFKPPSPPSKVSLIATPIFSSSLFAGAVLVAMLVFAAAPPFGLGVIGATLIMAGIGVLVGLAIDAYRERRYRKIDKEYKDARTALTFGNSFVEEKNSPTQDPVPTKEKAEECHSEKGPN